MASDTTPMMVACDCHALPNSGSVNPAMNEVRHDAPTGPQVQNAKACARPNGVTM
jgi:hypothetical protein